MYYFRWESLTASPVLGRSHYTVKQDLNVSVLTREFDYGQLLNILRQGRGHSHTDSPVIEQGFKQGRKLHVDALHNVHGLFLPIRFSRLD